MADVTPPPLCYEEESGDHIVCMRNCRPCIDMKQQDQISKNVIKSMKGRKRIRQPVYEDETDAEVLPCHNRLREQPAVQTVSGFEVQCDDTLKTGTDELQEAITEVKERRLSGGWVYPVILNEYERLDGEKKR